MRFKFCFIERFSIKMIFENCYRNDNIFRMLGENAPPPTLGGNAPLTPWKIEKNNKSHTKISSSISLDSKPIKFKKKFWPGFEVFLDIC